MNTTSRTLPASGAAMDEIVRPSNRGRLLVRLGAAAAVAALLFAGWRLMPRGLQVPAVDVRTARVGSGVFYDDVALRAKAVSLNSVLLDAVDGGRVEEVVARDGASVHRGDVLFRISNPQRNLELLQRQSELAQQISNLSSLKVDFEASRSEHLRRAQDIDFNLDQALKKQARDQGLARQGFLSPAALSESNDLVDKLRQQKDEEARRDAVETAVKRSAMDQMDRAVQQISRGLALVSASVDALVVRAPADGRLTDFVLDVGATVKDGQHIGRIDDPDHFKLTAQVDEYYLSRMRTGLAGSVQVGGRDVPVHVARILPQVTDGHFTTELAFDTGAKPDLSPGQGVDARVMMGEPHQALLLPNGAFLADSGGAWAYVVGPDGHDAQRRPIRIGRRNDRQVEVVSGLEAGDTVIVSSYASFGNAQRLQLR